MRVTKHTSRLVSDYTQCCRNWY